MESLRAALIIEYQRLDLEYEVIRGPCRGTEGEGQALRGGRPGTGEAARLPGHSADEESLEVSSG